MRFFSTDNLPVDYPDTKIELLLRIKNDSTSRSGKKIAWDYFTSYFRNGGNIIHPVLGNLDDFRKHMQKHWDFMLNGVNTIAATIERCLEGCDVPHLSTPSR